MTFVDSRVPSLCLTTIMSLAPLAKDSFSSPAYPFLQVSLAWIPCQIVNKNRIESELFFIFGFISSARSWKLLAGCQVWGLSVMTQRLLLQHCSPFLLKQVRNLFQIETARNLNQVWVSFELIWISFESLWITIKLIWITFESFLNWFESL